MKLAKEDVHIDAIAETTDEIQVEFNTKSRKLYVHVNGQTILRIGRCPKLTIEVDGRSTSKTI